MKNRLMVFILTISLVTAIALAENRNSSSMIERLSNSYRLSDTNKELTNAGFLLKKYSNQNDELHTRALKKLAVQRQLHSIIKKQTKPSKLVPAFIHQLAQLESNGNLKLFFDQFRASVKNGSTGTISGTVKVEGSTPARTVLLLAFNEFGYFAGEANTEGNGDFVLSGLNPGRYYVMTWSRYYVDQIYDGVVAPLASLETWRMATLIEVQANQTVSNIEFNLQSGAVVKGTLFHQDGVTRVQDKVFTVIVTSENSPVPVLSTTDTVVDGFYEFKIPATGKFRLAMKVEDFSNTWYPNHEEWISSKVVTIPTLASSVTDIDFQLLPPQDDGMKGSIAGTVVPAEGGFSPVKIAYAINLRDTSFANLGFGLLFEGYTIDDLPSGEYYVYGNDYIGNLFGEGQNYMGEFWEDAHDPDAATAVTVQAGETTSGINFLLDKGGSISGKILNHDKSPLDSLMVIAFHADIGGPGKDPFLTRLQVAAAVTNLDGEYNISGLPAGDYILRTFSEQVIVLDLLNLDINNIIRPGKHRGKIVDEYYSGIQNLFDLSQATRVTVSVPNETDGIDFELAPPAFFSGVITDAQNDNELSGKMIAALDPESGYPFWPLGTSSENGSYTIGPLAQGDYKLIAVSGLKGTDIHLTEFYDGVRSFQDANILSLNEDQANIDFTLDQGAAIRGFIDLSQGDLYSAGRDTLDGIPVVIFNAETGQLVNYDFVQFSGGFIVDRLLAGTYKMMTLPMASSYAATYYGGGDHFLDSDAMTIQLEFGQTVEKNIELEKATGGIQGNILVKDTGEPLSGIGVIVYDPSGHVVGFDVSDIHLKSGVQTTKDGRFSVQALRDGDYFIRSFSLTKGMDVFRGLMDSFGFLQDDLDFMGLIGGEMDLDLDLNFDLPLWDDVWYVNSPATIKYNINDLLMQFLAHGFPSEYENTLAPVYLPLPFNDTIPTDASLVKVSNGELTLGIQIELNKGSLENIVVDVEKKPVLPKDFKIYQNYPNPFNPTTVIPFVLEKRSNVKVIIYDRLGKVVNTLVNKTLSPGENKIVWYGDTRAGVPVSAGVYFAHIEVGNVSETIKMLLIR